MTRLAIMGSGKLAKIIAEAVNKGMLEDYELVAIFGKTKAHVEELAGLVKKPAEHQEGDLEQSGTAGTVAVCTTMEELLATKPEIVVEMASVASVKDHVETILTNGASLVALSIGAFADETFLENVKQTAKMHGTKIYLASGAVGGFDVLKTLSLMSNGKMRQQFITHKGPDSLRNTPLFTEDLVDESIQSSGDDTKVFEGNAKEAIALLPTKVNVAVAASLAGAGVEDTHVSIHSTYGMSGDDHCIVAEAAGCTTMIDTFSPTAAIAGWSVVALLQNLASPVVVF